MGVEALGMKMTYPEYLELERKSDVRHEYLRGEVFAMAGRTPQHSYLANEIGGELLRARDDKEAVTKPTLVVEVLSDSTEAHDRGAKLAHYRRLTSLQEVVLISQAPQRVEVWRRATGHFEVFEWGPGQLIELA